MDESRATSRAAPSPAPTHVCKSRAWDRSLDYRVPLDRQKYIGAGMPLSTPEFIRTMRADTRDLSPHRAEVVEAVNQVKFRHDICQIAHASTFIVEIVEVF